MGTINSFTTNLLQSSLFQTTATAASQQADKIRTVAPEPGADTNQLSPLGQVLSQLQDLQKNRPVVYQDITKQIANNLQSAANAQITKSDTTGAKQLNLIAATFNQASGSGQLPNIQNLAQGAHGAGHHHLHSHSAPPSESDATAPSPYQSPTDTGSSNQALPIILQTLSKAGA